VKPAAAVGLGIAIISIPLGWATNVPGWIVWTLAVAGGALIAWAGALFAFEQWIRPRRFSPKIEAEPPNGGIGEDLGPFSDNRVPARLHATIVTIVFLNTARSGDRGSIASGVTATIEVFDAGEQRVARGHGRWQNLGWRPLTPRSGAGQFPPIKVDMAPDGARHHLDVFARLFLTYENAPNRTIGCSVVKEPQHLMFAERRLDPGEYRVQVVLRGDTLRETHFDYTLEVHGPSDDEYGTRAPKLTAA
jgi:hypothetical protein